MAGHAGPDGPADGAAGGAAGHVPVLAAEVAALLAPALEAPGSVLLDATLGLAGHTISLAVEHPGLRVIGLDRDPQALALARARAEDAGIGDRLVTVRAVFDELDAAVARFAPAGRVQGVLFDLGVSSMQLDRTERGFAYASDAPLDMRMDPDGPLTAADVLNTYPAADLARVLRQYGEERFATRIAAAVVAERARAPFDTSARLVDLIRSAIPAAARRTGGHPAKRTFQALRIEVNDELGALRRALPQALARLAVGGRLVVMSYQSLEDRIVKHALAPLTLSTTPAGLPVDLPGHEAQLRWLTRSAHRPADIEVSSNPRAASARLRAVERVREAP